MLLSTRHGLAGSEIKVRDGHLLTLVNGPRCRVHHAAACIRRVGDLYPQLAHVAMHTAVHGNTYTWLTRVVEHGSPGIETETVRLAS